MCETGGLRCAYHAAVPAQRTRETYDSKFADGPPVDALVASESAMQEEAWLAVCQATQDKSDAIARTEASVQALENEVARLERAGDIAGADQARAALNESVALSEELRAERARTASTLGWPWNDEHEPAALNEARQEYARALQAWNAESAFLRDAERGYAEVARTWREANESVSRAQEDLDASSERYRAVAQEIYEEHGVRTTMARFYASDTLEALTTRGKAALKVKRNHPDEQRTKDAAAAALSDSRVSAAVASRTLATAELQAAQLRAASAAEALGPAQRVQMGVQNRVSLREADVFRARKEVTHVRARARSGASITGHPASIGTVNLSEVTVNADGSTNLWVVENPDSAVPRYVHVVGVREHVTSTGGTSPVLTTADGRAVLHRERMSSRRSESRDPEVWVGQPLPGARPIREVHSRILLHDTLDSGD